jgi:hypothetical protein
MYLEPDTFSGLTERGPRVPTGIPTNLPKVIGLTGYAQVGKDTVANLLGEYGYKRLSLADPIKKALYTLNPIFQVDSVGRIHRLQDVVDEIGWEETKKAGPLTDGTPEGRRLPQVFGTEVGRSLLGDDVWLQVAERTMNKTPNQRWVISDVRFPNEARWVRSLGGEVIKIVRHGTEPVNAHVSDQGLSGDLVDSVLPNHLGMDDLRDTLAVLIKMMSGTF